MNKDPKVDIDRVVEYNRILEEATGFEIGGDVTLWRTRKSLNKTKLFRAFKKFEGLDQYENFKEVFKRLNFYSYHDIITVLYWYTYFLYLQNKVNEDVVIKGYQSLMEYIVLDTETEKVYGIYAVYDLIKFEEDGKLKFEKSRLEFKEYQRDGQTFFKMNKVIEEDNRFDIEIPDFYFANKEECKSYEIVYVTEFLKEIHKLSKDNRELLVILILGLKVLKKNISEGYGYYREQDARQINKSIGKLRKNIENSQHSNWVEDLTENNKLFGWWD